MGTIPNELGAVPLTARRFTIEEVSSITGISVGHLRNLRRQDKGPLMYRLGKLLWCDEPDLIAWSTEQKAMTAKGDALPSPKLTSTQA